METNATLAIVSKNDLAEIVEQAVTKALRQHEPTPHTPSETVEALSFDQVRLALKISSPTLRKLIRSGRLHAVQTGRRWLVPSGEVARFLAGGSQ